MDIDLILIVIFLILALVFLILFLLKSFSKKSFIADDGSVFQNQQDLDLYKNLYDTTKPLFSVSEQESSSTQAILGFDKSFLVILTKKGFSDLNALIKYRKQIQSLSDLINS